jgi:hypothetical protein
LKEKNSFKNLGQYKAYLREINNFDQLYIIQQFESYLQEVDEIKDLAYMINSNKANINEVKQAFKEVFKRNSNEIFKTNPNIWKQFDRVDGTGKINSLKNFKDLVEDISFDAKHPIFNFIKAE